MSRNRTLSHLYTNNIPNVVFLAGDSHANWVSDLVWLDTKPYDQSTGVGSIGVEFAGTAVSSSGFGGTIESANGKSRGLVRDNRELQWSEGYYRGYYELQVSPERIEASYFGECATRVLHIIFLVLCVYMAMGFIVNTLTGCPTVATRNPFKISLANFTVLAGDNRLQRNVANGSVESGALQIGSVKQTNLTLNTEAGTWNLTTFDQMFIKY